MGRVILCALTKRRPVRGAYLESLLPAHQLITHGFDMTMNRTFRMSLRYSLFILIFVFSAICVQPQTTLYDGDQPLAPFGGFSSGEIDTIALQNGNLHLDIPLISLPERGGKYTFSLLFDTPSFTETQTENRSPGGGPVIFDTTVAMNPYGGFRIPSTSTTWGITDALSSGTCGGTTDATEYVNFTAIDPRGQPHPLYLRTSELCGNITSSPSFDGSGLIANITVSSDYVMSSATIRLPDGTLIGPQTSQINANQQLVQTATSEDSNGNITSIQDTYGTTNASPLVSTVITNNAGNQITVTYGAQISYTSPAGKSASGPANAVISYRDSNGTTQSYDVNFEAIDVSPDISCTPSTYHYCIIPKPSIVVPKSISLPDGTTQYVFQWYNASMGELQSVTLPTGATISYTYNTLCTSPPGTVGFYYQCLRSVASKTVTSSGQSSTWTYNITPFSDYASQTTVTDPFGNAEVHNYGVVTLSSGATSTSTVETGVLNYSGSASGGHLLRAVSTQYTGEPGPNPLYPVVNIRPNVVTTTLDNGLVSETQTTYETFTYSGNVATRMNPTQVEEYAYGTGAPGALMRKTIYTYLHNVNSAYVAPNIVNRPQSVTVYNGSGTQEAYTAYEYDNYTAGIQSSGATQHDSTYSTTYTLRGNVTATNQWVNTNGSMLVTRNQYDDAGNVVSVTDPKGNATQYSFADVWQNSACAPASGQARAFPTSITNALNQTTALTYYSCSGLPATIRDPNLETTSMSYDWAGRMILTNYPDGGSVSVGYNGDALPLTVTKTQSASPDPAITSSVTYDGLGRPLIATLPNGAYTANGYALNGELCASSNPSATAPPAAGLSCTPSQNSTSSATDGIKYWSYDALGRKILETEQDGSTESWTYSGNTTIFKDENGNQWQRTFDALGRLTEVLEPSGTSSAPSMETDFSYDTLDDLGSVTQWGGSSGSSEARTRGFNYDSLSRIISATNPETGTITYQYALAGGGLCAGDSSLPCSKTDNRGVITNYTYDSLNRLTSKTYASDGSATPISCYQYDTSGISGPGSNLVGRLTNQWTQSSSSGSCSASVPTTGGYITLKAILAYDPMGRPTNEEQCTLSNCANSTPYALTLGYDQAGNLNSYTNGLGTTPGAGSGPLTFTQSYDDAGELQTVTSSWNDTAHPASLFSAQSSSGAACGQMSAYSPFGALTNAVYGNGLTLSRAYDSRLRVNCEKDIGNLVVSATSGTATVTVAGEEQTK